jgi:hypothetical protein
MKQKISIAFFLLFALAACGENKPVAVVADPVTSIEQQNRDIAARLAAQKGANETKSAAEAEVTDRRRLVAAVQEPTARWIAVYEKIGGKRANEIDALLTEMQAIRAELASASTSTCTDPKRAAIISGMDQVSALMAEFKSTNGNVDASFSSRIGSAAESILNAAGAVAACTQPQQ